MTIQQLYAKLCTPEFQDAANGSLNYNFYIYQYPADKEYEMRDNIVDFCEKLARPAIYVDVLALNLFEEFCEHLRQTPIGETNALQDILEGEIDFPEQIMSELSDIGRSKEFYEFLNERIKKHLEDQHTGSATPYIFVYGIGSMFPYLRANVFLTCWEQFNNANRYKVILFYPGESKENSYSLFGRLDDMHAYRATLLNYSE